MKTKESFTGDLFYHDSILQQKTVSDFKEWWDSEGSGIAPEEEDNIHEFVERMCEIAWINGAYKTAVYKDKK